MAATPTQRTLQECRNRGWLASVAEKFNHHTNRRNDLFGFIDVVALTDSGILGIQATSGDNVSSRVKKIREERGTEALRWLQAGGAIQVWGWREYAKPVNRKRWRPRIVEITETELTEETNGANTR